MQCIGGSPTGDKVSAAMEACFGTENSDVNRAMAFIIKTNSHNLQVLGVGLAVSLCITVIFIWGLLNINKIQVILCSLQNLHSNTLHHLQVYARNSRVTWLDFLLKKHK